MSKNTATLRNELLSVNGSTVSRGGQAFAFDERNRHIYHLEEGAINRYPMDGSVGITPIDASLINGAVIGHQGLAVEYLTSSIKLWVTNATLGRQATRFTYTPNVAIDTGETYLLFESGRFNGASCTPAVSHDQRYLVAHGGLFGKYTGVVRVFDLARLVREGAGDYTTKYLYEWEPAAITNDLNPVQGIACDGVYVYMFAGGSGFTPNVNKRLHVYTLQGELVYRDDDNQVGWDEAKLSPGGNRFEPEGLSMLTGPDGKPTLVMGVMSGNPGFRRFHYHQLKPEFRTYLGNKRNTFIARLNDFSDMVNRKLAIPVNLKNSLLVTAANGSFSGRTVFQQSSIIETDAELANMKGLSEPFSAVFNTWKRISRGGATYTDEYIPAELTAWTYDAPSDSIKTSINSGSVMGFVSPEKFDEYVFEAQVSSANNDDDFIGLIIAYARDPADGTTHTLSVNRGGNGKAPMSIDKDYNGYDTSKYNVARMLAPLTWINGTVATEPGVNGANGGWLSNPTGCRIKVTRAKDIITVETSQMGDTVMVPGATVTFDLSVDPQLAVFRGPQSYGYTATSQPTATWKVFQNPSIRLPIVDVRDWSKWIFADGAWTKVTGTKNSLIADGLLIPEWTHQNTATGKFFFMDAAKKLYRL